MYLEKDIFSSRSFEKTAPGTSPKACFNNNNFYLYSAVYPDIKPVQRLLKYNICKT